MRRTHNFSDWDCALECKPSEIFDISLDLKSLWCFLIYPWYLEHVFKLIWAECSGVVLTYDNNSKSMSVEGKNTCNLIYFASIIFQMLLISQFHFLCLNRSLNIIRTAAHVQIRTPSRRIQKCTHILYEYAEFICISVIVHNNTCLQNLSG